MSIATQDDFLKPSPRRYRYVDVPGWRRVRIQNMTEAENARWQLGQLDDNGAPDRKKMQTSRLRRIVMCVVNEDGHRILTDEHFPQLEKLDGAITDYLDDAIIAHCGLASDEGTEKNSSDLPETGAGDSQ